MEKHHRPGDYYDYMDFPIYKYNWPSLFVGMAPAGADLWVEDLRNPSDVTGSLRGVPRFEYSRILVSMGVLDPLWLPGPIVQCHWNQSQTTNQEQQKERSTVHHSLMGDFEKLHKAKWWQLWETG